MKSLVAVLLVIPLVAGCLDDPSAAKDNAAADVPFTLPVLDYDLKEAVAFWEEIATQYPKHDSYLPTIDPLRARIVAELEESGFDVEIRAYSAEVQGVMLPDVPDGPRAHAIVATKPGLTQPDHYIGFTSHYDSAQTTVQAAYDNKAGTAVEMAICKALAQLPLDKTIACLFFDGEEEGLVASGAYVRDAIQDGDEAITYDYILAYDMVGINWPGHAWPLDVHPAEIVDQETGDAEPSPLGPWARAFYANLGYPAEGVTVLDGYSRSSDELSFVAAGIPVLRYAGGRTASDYPAYHMPFDTVEFVDLYVGGRANFEAGFNTAVETGFAAAVRLDDLTLGQVAEQATAGTA